MGERGDASEWRVQLGQSAARCGACVWGAACDAACVVVVEDAVLTDSLVVSEPQPHLGDRGQNVVVRDVPGV